MESMIPLESISSFPGPQSANLILFSYGKQWKAKGVTGIELFNCRHVLMMIMNGSLVYSAMFQAENESSKLALEQSEQMLRLEELQEKQRRCSPVYEQAEIEIGVWEQGYSN